MSPRAPVAARSRPARGNGARRRRVVVLYNHDFDPAAHDYAARSDVEKTAHAVAAAIDACEGLEAELLAVHGASLDFADALVRTPGDVVFNLCESLDGRAENEALVPALLDFLRVPYTGSGVFTLAAALRKDRAKELLQANQVSTPPGVVARARGRLPAPLGFPVIVKPLREDGSLGISAASVARNQRALDLQVEALLDTYRQPVLIEAFVEGREIIVPMLGDRELYPLPLSEIDFSNMPEGLPHIVTYRGKWDEESEEYHGSAVRLDPSLAPGVAARIMQMAEKAYRGLECTGYARIDIRLAEDGTPYVIDVNPNCDLSPQGGFFRACRAARMSYADMVRRIVELAIARHADAAAPKAIDKTLAKAIAREPVRRAAKTKETPVRGVVS